MVGLPGGTEYLLYIQWVDPLCTKCLAWQLTHSQTQKANDLIASTIATCYTKPQACKQHKLPGNILTWCAQTATRPPQALPKWQGVVTWHAEGTDQAP